MTMKVGIVLVLVTISFSQRINLNSASIENMQSLDISNEKIDNIIDYRNRFGNIQNIYELLKINPN